MEAQHKITTEWEESTGSRKGEVVKTSPRDEDVSDVKKLTLKKFVDVLRKGYDLCLYLRKVFGSKTVLTKDKDINTLGEAFSKRRVLYSHIVIPLLLIIGIFISIWVRSPPTFDDNYVCQSPQVIQPWQITAFRPKWFGLFGGPGPITYKTRGGKGHRIGIVDIDRRDIEIATRVDDKYIAHRPVVLDNTVFCGEDLTKCVNMGFGAAFISVPPGNHVVRAEILDVNGSFRWEHERKRRVWWMVEQCS